MTDGTDVLQERWDQERELRPLSQTETAGPDHTARSTRMTTIKTPEQIAADVMGDTDTTTMWSDHAGGWVTIASQIAAAIEADRAQRHHWDAEIYIVQNESGDVVDAFWDADEATAAYQEDYSIIAETAWEPGEYAEQRIRTLRAEFIDAAGDQPADTMSADDWAYGLNEEDAAEIARLIEWQEGQK